MNNVINLLSDEFAQKMAKVKKEYNKLFEHTSEEYANRKRQTGKDEAYL